MEKVLNGTEKRHDVQVSVLMAELTPYQIFKLPSYEKRAMAALPS